MVLPAVPPLSPYGTFAGSLFQYSRNLVAFESAPPTGPPPIRKCILIGGLSDGLVPTPYTKKLEEACHVQGWSLVQPVISSSYLGFGNGSLDRDTNEIRYVGKMRFPVFDAKRSNVSSEVSYVLSLLFGNDVLTIVTAN